MGLSAADDNDDDDSGHCTSNIPAWNMYDSYEKGRFMKLGRTIYRGLKIVQVYTVVMRQFNHGPMAAV